MSHTETIDQTERADSFDDSLLSNLPSLRKQAMALTRHRADAEDLVQGAVTSALAARDSFCPGTNFHAWITRILRNRFFSEVRGRRTVVDIADVPAGRLSQSGGQEDILAIKDLWRHMLRLPTNQRVILLMISVEGVSYGEASEQLGVAAGTLKSHVFRARAQLQLWMLDEQFGAARASRKSDNANSPQGRSDQKRSAAAYAAE